MPRRALTYDPLTRIKPESKTEELIWIMQEEKELAESKRILEEMGPKLREKVDDIRKLMKTEIYSVLRGRYSLGVHLLEIYNDATNNGAKVYGQHAIENICKVLGLDDSLVRACMKFVQMFSREQLEEFTTKMLPRGEPISWSHIRCVLQVEDENKRGKLLDKTFEEGWTCSELACEVKSLESHDEDDGRGRPLKVPTGLDSFVQQQMQVVEQWENRYLKVWSNPRHSLSSMVAKLAAEEVTEEQLKSLGELAHRLRGMGEQVTHAAEKAEAAFHEFQRLLSNKLEPGAAAIEASTAKGSKEPGPAPATSKKGKAGKHR